jgi:hypothetical protein
MKKKIYVRGPVLSQSGYGEQSRFALRALKSQEDIFDIYIQPINWGKTGWIWEDNEFRKWMDSKITKTQTLLHQKKLQPDISLQITIPNEFEKICPVNIGYTAGIKVLVVSNHAKSSIVDTIAQATNNQTGETFPYRCETPVEVVWENTPNALPEKIPGFNLEFDKNFLLVSQLGPRKNFENTVCWFIEEFIDQEVGLVIKTNFKGNSIIDFSQVEKHLKSLLERYENRKCKIYLLHGDLTVGQMTSLYSHPSIVALTNISHGEGFGLPMFEAARLALPVITIGWSGQVDFLHQNGKNYFQSVDFTMRPVQSQAVWEGVIEKESMWAFADQGSYKMTLRKTLKNLDKVKGRAKELQTLISDKFSDEKLFENFCRQIYNPEMDIVIL